MLRGTKYPKLAQDELKPAIEAQIAHNIREIMKAQDAVAGLTHTLAKLYAQTIQLKGLTAQLEDK